MFTRRGGSASTPASLPPLVVHLLFRFDTGGLENGVVNLINHMPQSAYRHAVVALTEVVPEFSRRIQRDDVEFVALDKAPGHGVKLYPRLLTLFRELAPCDRPHPQPGGAGVPGAGRAGRRAGAHPRRAWPRRR